MPVEHPNITLGTAGHIDHGKTALIKFFTGCDTDRLKEEKERGMSIDLGFAPCTIANMQVGIVDVPGHENFIKTMVAGASAVDGCILVVAADDGVMPQTREHLDILTLLGVEHGVVALTKMDCVEPDLLEVVRDETRRFLQGTFLENAPVVPVCNLTGQGFEALYEAVADMVNAIEPRRTDGVFRLPVERAFSAKGFGTVVAGVPVTGSVRLGDELVLLPQGLSGRVRRIEVYGRSGEVASAGQCAALNIGHWEREAVRRGDTLAAPGYFAPSQWYACALRLLPYERLFLKSGARVRFHTGTSEVVGALYLLEGDRLGAAATGLAQVKLAKPLVAGPGDRFIIRALSPVQTVGGGTVIEALPKRLKRSRPAVREDLAERAAAVPDERNFVEYCVRKTESIVAREGDIAQRAKLPRGRLAEILSRLVAEHKVTQPTPGSYIHSQTAAEEGQKLLDIIGRFHDGAPDSPGLTPARLQDESGLARPAFQGVVAWLMGEGKLLQDGGRLALPGHTVRFSAADRELLDSVENLFLERRFAPPGVEDAAAATGALRQKIEWAFDVLLDHAVLVRVPPGLLFHRAAVDQAREILTSFIRNEGRLESVQFKYLLDTTRKFAIPLLDYFDKIGVTLRVGYTRHLRDP